MSRGSRNLHCELCQIHAYVVFSGLTIFLRSIILSFRLDRAKTGPLAQLVEQMTLNHRVVGSSPTRPIIIPVDQS